MSSKEILKNEIKCSIDEIKEAASISIKELSKNLILPTTESPSTSTILKSLKQYYSQTFKKEDSVLTNLNPKEEGNILSEFLPGYIAPMKLKPYNEKEKLYSKNGYLSTTLHQNNNSSSKNEQEIQNKQAVKELMEPVKDQPIISFKKGKKSIKDDKIADDNWFGIEQNKESEELDDDLKVLQMRDVIDPKRFYKSYNTNDKDGKAVVRQVGTVVEGANEYFSGRMAKKERRQNITEEFMSDVGVSTYTKDKFEKIQLAEKMKRLPSKKVKHSKHVYKRY